MKRKARRISTHLLFYFAPRRDCPFHLSAWKRILVSVALLRFWRKIPRDYPLSGFLKPLRTGITRYVILRSPDFPPAIETMTGSHILPAYIKDLPRVELTACVANLSAKLFSSRGIWLIKTFSKPVKRCTARLYKFIIPAFLTL